MRTLLLLALLALGCGGPRGVYDAQTRALARGDGAAYVRTLEPATRPVDQEALDATRAWVDDAGALRRELVRRLPRERDQVAAGIPDSPQSDAWRRRFGPPYSIPLRFERDASTGVGRDRKTGQVIVRYARHADGQWYERRARDGPAIKHRAWTPWWVTRAGQARRARQALALIEERDLRDPARIRLALDWALRYPQSIEPRLSASTRPVRPGPTFDEFVVQERQRAIADAERYLERRRADASRWATRPPRNAPTFTIVDGSGEAHGRTVFTQLRAARFTSADGRSVELGVPIRWQLEEGERVTLENGVVLAQERGLLRIDGRPMRSTSVVLRADGTLRQNAFLTDPNRRAPATTRAVRLQ